MQIGYYPHFNWRGARSDRWRRLASALLGGDKYVFHMTAVLNLDWSHETDEGEVPVEHMRFGFEEYVWPTLQVVQPRIICALTNQVWNVMTPKIQGTTLKKEQFQLPKDPIIFRFPGAKADSFLIKSHNHPSRPFLGRRQIATLGEATAWFLARPLDGHLEAPRDILPTQTSGESPARVPLEDE